MDGANEEAKRYGMLTLMSGIEYAVILEAAWSMQDEDKFMKVLTPNNRPCLFNKDGVLIVKEVSSEEYNTWMEKQRFLEELQNKKIQELRDREKATSVVENVATGA